jgi:hypothetical protein
VTRVRCADRLERAIATGSKFALSETGKIAVKVINHNGDEVREVFKE